MESDVSLIDILVFPTGRRLYSLGLVQEAIADGDAEAPLRARVEAALAADRKTRALELRYEGQDSAAEHGPDAPALSHDIERALSGLDETLRSNIRSFPADDPVAVASRQVRKALLPSGVAAITELDFVQELETLSTLLKTAAEPDVAGQLDAAKTQHYVDRLSGLVERFRASVGAGQAGAVGFDQVKKARATGQRNLLEVVAWVLGHYLEDTEDQVAARERLLRPILDQNEDIHRQHSRQLAVTDVDPNTGQAVHPGTGGGA